VDEQHRREPTGAPIGRSAKAGKDAGRLSVEEIARTNPVEAASVNRGGCFKAIMSHGPLERMVGLVGGQRDLPKAIACFPDQAILPACLIACRFQGMGILS
jgi:hypothetical protein